MLITEISKQQGLGTTAKEMPLIIHTETHTFNMAYLMYEDEDYLIIVVPNKDGAEYAKILTKTSILTVEVIYAQMLEKPEQEEDINYG